MSERSQTIYVSYKVKWALQLVAKKLNQMQPETNRTVDGLADGLLWESIIKTHPVVDDMWKRRQALDEEKL